MKKSTGLMMVVALGLGIYFGKAHGDKITHALQGLKSEFRIAYVDKVFGELDTNEEEQLDAGPTTEVEEGE